MSVPVAKGSSYKTLRRDAAAASERLRPRKPAGPSSTTKRIPTLAVAQLTHRVLTNADSAAVGELQTRKKALAQRLQEKLIPR